MATADVFKMVLNENPTESVCVCVFSQLEGIEEVQRNFSFISLTNWIINPTLRSSCSCVPTTFLLTRLKVSVNDREPLALLTAPEENRCVHVWVLFRRVFVCCSLCRRQTWCRQVVSVVFYSFILALSPLTLSQGPHTV